MHFQVFPVFIRHSERQAVEVKGDIRQMEQHD
jgi:hypothetical protein